MPALFAAIAVLTLIGHAAIWIGTVNRLHSTGLPRALVKSLTAVFYTLLWVLPGAALVGLAVDWPESSGAATHWNIASAYGAFCAAYGALHLSAWTYWQWKHRALPGGISVGDQRVVDIAQTLGRPPAVGLRTEVLSRLPGNQLWQLHITDFSLDLPRLPAALDGLTLCHWSDLHYCGRIDRTYFQEVARLTNAMGVDMIVLTGDICDKAECIGWIDETLGQIECRIGKFFVLGNHDLRTRDVPRLRAALGAAGFVDLGNRQQTILDGQIVLAGNERPWIQSSAAPDGAEPARADAFKILLSHSPDQFAWARERQFDLMLAGHTHGGQIRFPLLGAVVCPSWHGTDYAQGFFQARPTLMHVSRGTASLFPIRFRCPPEITRLTLRSGRGRA